MISVSLNCYAFLNSYLLDLSWFSQMLTSWKILASFLSLVLLSLQRALMLLVAVGLILRSLDSFARFLMGLVSDAVAKLLFESFEEKSVIQLAVFVEFTIETSKVINFI